MKWSFALGLLVGCAMQPSVESQITITQGVYGQLVDTQSHPIAAAVVTAFGPPGPSDPVASNKTNHDGVYQLGIVGDFWLCTPTSCTATIVNVPDGALVRFDWTNGPDGGRWWSYSTTP